MRMHFTTEEMGLNPVTILICAVVIALLLPGCATEPTAQDTNVSLSGAQEVPPVKTAASASGSFVIASDRSVRGGITTANIDATMAHIHAGKAGQNGPVIIPLQKKGEN